MKKLVVGDCVLANTFVLNDPVAPSEAEFELTVIKALTCFFSGYRCFRFTGGFLYDGDCHRPDLALVARDLSHWFIIEVELVSHSLDRHVIPQVRAFRYGDTRSDCAKQISAALDIPLGSAESLIEFVPRAVAVISNRYHVTWETKLDALGIQYLNVSLFHTQAGASAIELSGHLHVVKEHLGFGTFQSTDRSVLFSSDVRLPEGEVMLTDPTGTKAMWKVAKDGQRTWATKCNGKPDIRDQCMLQLLLSFDEGFALRIPHTSRTNRR